MTALDNITSLGQRREAIVKQHAAAENRHDVEATIATFHQPRYELNGQPSDGEAAVRELLQGLMHGFPDLHAEIGKLRHGDDAVIIEGLITGTRDGEWAGTLASLAARGRPSLCPPLPARSRRGLAVGQAVGRCSSRASALMSSTSADRQSSSPRRSRGDVGDIGSARASDCTARVVKSASVDAGPV